MRSKILLGAGNYLMPILLMFSVFLLLRGHNSPGGGFVGGLTAACGMALYAISHGKGSLKRLLPLSSSSIMITGAAFMIFAGLFGLFAGGSFLHSSHADWELPIIGQPGTAFLFDVGVYLVVIGAITKIILTLTNE